MIGADQDADVRITPNDAGYTLARQWFQPRPDTTWEDLANIEFEPPDVAASTPLTESAFIRRLSATRLLPVLSIPSTRTHSDAELRATDLQPRRGFKQTRHFYAGDSGWSINVVIQVDPTSRGPPACASIPRHTSGGWLPPAPSPNGADLRGGGRLPIQPGQHDGLSALILGVNDGVPITQVQYDVDANGVARQRLDTGRPTVRIYLPRSDEMVVSTPARIRRRRHELVSRGAIWLDSSLPPRWTAGLVVLATEEGHHAVTSPEL